MERFDRLKREVKMMLEKLEKPLDQLEMIHLLQRLGISYGFEDKIERLLDNMCDAPFFGGPLTTRQPAEHSWMSGNPTLLTKIG